MDKNPFDLNNMTEVPICFCSLSTLQEDFYSSMKEWSFPWHSGYAYFPDSFAVKYGHVMEFWSIECEWW